MQSYQDVLAEILITAESLKVRVAELGALISADYSGRDLLLICILRGGVPFLVDLSRSITVPHMIDFMAVLCYECRGVSARLSCLDGSVVELPAFVKERAAFGANDFNGQRITAFAYNAHVHSR